MNSFTWYILSSIFIIEGILSLMGYQIFFKYSGWKFISIDMSIFFIIVGFIFFYAGMKAKQKIEFSKCPKCKEDYRYETLKDGICPTCKIKTIEMDEYFKKYPEELEDV